MATTAPAAGHGTALAPDADSWRPHLWVPSGFDPAAYLSGDLRRHDDFARWLVHRIVIGTIHGKADAAGYVQLGAKFQEKFCSGKGGVYKRVSASLVSGNAIATDGVYSKGEKSYGFKLGQKFEGMRHHKVAVGDKTLARKLTKARQDWTVAPEPVHKQLLAWLRRIEIDYPAALAFIEERDDIGPNVVTSIQLIRDREFYSNPCDDFGQRFHTNVTSLKSSLRKFLRYRGKPLVGLDIRNSQPLLFGLVLRDHYAGQALPADVEQYIELCEAGRFYEHMLSVWGYAPERRDRCKKSFYSSVLFCELAPEYPRARQFAEAFPNVYAAIRRMKTPDYKEPARRLQRTESNIIIRGVAARFMAEAPEAFITTIHDAVLVTPEHAELAERITVEEFAKVGSNPKIKIESVD